MGRWVRLWSSRETLGGLERTARAFNMRSIGRCVVWVIGEGCACVCHMGRRIAADFRTADVMVWRHGEAS